MIPGIAYPEIDNVDKKPSNLLFNTRLPKLAVKEKNIIKSEVKKIKIKVFKFNLRRLRLSKYSGNLYDQKIICENGKIKLIKNSVKQKKKAAKALAPFSFFL